MQPLDETIKDDLNRLLNDIESLSDNCDALTIIGPILPGLDQIVRNAIESIENKKDGLIIIHSTNGGVVEVVERMVSVIRNFYNKVTFIVPDQAMSAGTIFVLSGNEIMMDYFSILGPIDPQIVKDDKLVPALSYLNQFERLNKKAEEGSLTTAEFALLQSLDLGELHQFEQALELSEELLVKWLSEYKFKDWKKTNERGIKVTAEMKRNKASEIARILSDNERWHSHGRGINIAVLENEIGLKITDYSNNEKRKCIHDYFRLLLDYMSRQQLHYFVHTSNFF